MATIFDRRPGQMVDVDGTLLHVVHKAADVPASLTLPPVVLIHGKFGSVYDFLMTPLVDELAEQQRVLVVDRPGCGFSINPDERPLTLDDQATLLHGLLMSLGVERPILVGHSLGASLVLTLALRYPEAASGYVLLAPYAYAGAGPGHARIGSLLELPGVGRALLSPIRRMMLAAVDKMYAAIFRPAPVPAGYIDLVKAVALHPAAFRADMETILSADATLAALAPRYGEITAPTAIVVGASDQTTALERQAHPLRQTLPAARLAVLPGVGHMVQFHAPGVVRAAVQAVAVGWKST